MHELPVEVKVLAASVVLGLLQLLLAANFARKQQSFAWGASARDEPRPLTGVAARLDRAFANFRETFSLFAVSVLIVWYADRLGPLTYWGSLTYLICRVLYVPLYAAGVPWVRSLVWQVGFVGQVLVLVPLLF